MEKSSRRTIAHKIKVCTYDDNKPKLQKASKSLRKNILKYLNTKASNFTKYEHIAIIYNLVDEIIETNNHLIVCRSGCAHCCRIAVDVMPLEIKYISEKTGLQFNKLSESPPKNTYCNFLNTITAQCSIYKYRPFCCRVFVAYDSPDYCRDNLTHWISGGATNEFGNKAIFELFLKLYKISSCAKSKQELLDNVENQISDIRQYEIMDKINND